MSIRTLSPSSKLPYLKVNDEFSLTFQKSRDDSRWGGGFYFEVRHKAWCHIEYSIHYDMIKDDPHGYEKFFGFLKDANPYELDFFKTRVKEYVELKSK